MASAGETSRKRHDPRRAGLIVALSAVVLPPTYLFATGVLVTALHLPAMRTSPTRLTGPSVLVVGVIVDVTATRRPNLRSHEQRGVRIPSVGDIVNGPNPLV